MAGSRRTARQEPVKVWGQARRRAQPASSASAPCPTPCRARMQDDYPANAGVRPRRVCNTGQAELISGRLFLCAVCRHQVIVCSCCDRGQIYCAGACARQARRRTIQQAGRRYQASRRGRRLHAARMGRWRARRQKVTHHGSPALPAGDLLLPAAMTTPRNAAAPADQPRLLSWA